MLTVTPIDFLLPLTLTVNSILIPGRKCGEGTLVEYDKIMWPSLGLNSYNYAICTTSCDIKTRRCPTTAYFGNDIDKDCKWTTLTGSNYETRECK